MTTAIVVLLLVTALVALSILRPGDAVEFPPSSTDRDQERQLAELRAMADPRPGPQDSWNAASRSASAPTSSSTVRASGWNGSHRTSPSM
jgi:hypothetical protein